MERFSIERCGRLLAIKHLTLAFAESATAGRAAMEFSLCERAGEFLKGGLVCYDAYLKEQVLQVPKPLIDEFTPESPEVTYAIAKGLGELIDADISIGITGLTRTGGSETEEKPVGTMFFCAILGGEILFEDRQYFKGDQNEISSKAVAHLSELLFNALS